MSLTMLPMVAVDEVDVDWANRLLVEWNHPLGPCHRLFEQRAHVLAVDGEPIAATVMASPVSPTVDKEPRRGVVELARIVRSPDHPWCLRVMLRLWRARLVHDWATWPVTTSIAYALPGTPGDIYRFDGWERVGARRRASVGTTSTWSRPSAADQIDDGVKTLWRYRYEVAP